jgi:hypothetical protein
LNNPAGIRGVRRFQVTLPYLYGSQDSKSFEHLGTDSRPEDSYFAIDTRDHSQKTFPSEAALAQYAQERGGQLKLEPLLNVYQEQRSHVFDLCAVAVLLVFPPLSLGLMVRWVYRLKQTAQQS